MPYGLTSIKVGSKIVPVRNFGKATHLVVCIINDLYCPEIDSVDDQVVYIPLDSESNLTDYPERFIEEIIFCSESDWSRLKSTIDDNQDDDYYDDDYYNVCRTVPNGGVSEYSDFIKKHY